MGKGTAACIGGSAGSILTGLVYGGLNAAYGAASGAVGSAVLNAAGHTGYAVLESTQGGALGNAIIGASMGVCGGGIVGSLVSCGLFGNNNKGSDDKKSQSGNLCINGVVHVGVQTLGGMLGWAVMNAGEAETIMSLGQTAAALATGSAITMIPAACVTTCIALPLVLAGVACAISMNNDKDVAVEDEKPAPLPV
jgi:hypothetical protein